MTNKPVLMPLCCRIPLPAWKIMAQVQAADYSLLAERFNMRGTSVAVIIYDPRLQSPEVVSSSGKLRGATLRTEVLSSLMKTVINQRETIVIEDLSRIKPSTMEERIHDSNGQRVLGDAQVRIKRVMPSGEEAVQDLPQSFVLSLIPELANGQLPLNGVALIVPLTIQGEKGFVFELHDQTPSQSSINAAKALASCPILQ